MNSICPISLCVMVWKRIAAIFFCIWHTWWVHNWDISTTPETVHPSRSHPFSCMPDQLQSAPVTLEVVRESHLLVEPADICRQKDTVKIFHVGDRRYWFNLAKVHMHAFFFACHAKSCYIRGVACLLPLSPQQSKLNGAIGGEDVHQYSTLQKIK